MHGSSESRSMGKDLGIAEQAQKHKASSNSKVAGIATEVSGL